MRAASMRSRRETSSRRQPRTAASTTSPAPRSRRRSWPGRLRSLLPAPARERRRGASRNSNSQRPAAIATQQFGDTLVSPELVGGGIVDATKAAELLESDTSHVPTAFEQLSARVVRVAKGGGRIGVRWSPSYDGRLSGYGVKLRCLRCARKVKQRWVRVEPTFERARVTVATAGEYEVSVTAFDEDGHAVPAS